MGSASGVVNPALLELARVTAYLQASSDRIISMATTNPLQFLSQVRAEVAKVVWPTRREVVMTTIMVFIMAALTAAFFSLVDWGIRSGLAMVLTSF
jgi:preprotein translocase subunit SecE